MCLAGAVVPSWTLTQEVDSSPFAVMTKIFLSLNSANSVKTFRENFNGCYYSIVGIVHTFQLFFSQNMRSECVDLMVNGRDAHRTTGDRTVGPTTSTVTADV